MKKILLTLLLCPSIMFAQHVSTDVAIQISQNYMGGISRTAPEIAYVERKSIGNHLCMYEVIFKDSSWCIVPADMRVEPILAYGFERSHGEDLPEPFLKLIEWYTAQLDTIIYYNSDTIATHPFWNQLSNTRYYGDYNVGDILLDRTGRGQLCWKQGKNNDNGCTPSYNQDCPSTLLDCYCCYHEPVGCAAVALGEILWYWRWPESSEYNWDGMPPKLKNSTAQDSASILSKFLFDCGSLINMTYACTGSFTIMDNIAEALNNTLGYNGAHKIFKSDWRHGSSWNDIIKSELDNKRPVLFYGDSWAFFEGHYFVVDGYEENGGFIRYHVNWGHGGWNNCFCKLDEFKEPTYDGHEYDTNNYSLNNRAIVGISPTYGLKHNISEVYYNVVPRNYYRNEYATNSISLPSFNSTLSVENGGELVIEAGQEMVLNDGFWAKRGSEVNVKINPEWRNGMAISVPFWPTFTDETGYGIRQENADSWEFSLMNRNYAIVFQSAGSIRSDYVTFWDGHGVMAGTYLGIITLKNSYGRSLHQELAITVTNRGQNDETDSVDDYVMTPNPNCLDISILDTALRAYPNPSDGIFELYLETDTIVSVNVYNTMGQHVYTDDNIMAGSYALNLSRFPIGEYIVVVRGKQKEYSTRLIKQKM